MSNAIFCFEVKSWLKSPLFYLLLTSFFLFSWITMLGTGGFFDESSNSTQDVKLLNSPYALGTISFLFTKLLLFVTAIFGGFSLYRDYSNKIHSILYSYPISKTYYLHGKLGSALFVLAASSIITFSGIYLGELMLGIDNPQIGINNPLGYLIILGLYLIPTILVIGIFVFVSVGISRNIFSGFIMVLCFVLFQILLENILFDNKELLAILDPFGQNAFYLATQNWDFETKNSNTLPINFIVLWNRIIWGLLAFSCYYFFVRKFDFQYDTIWQIKTNSSKDKAIENNLINQADLDSDIHYNFSTKARLKACYELMVYDFKSIIKSWMFLVLSCFGVLTVFFIQLKVCNTGAFNLLPLTRIFIGAPLSFYSLIIILSTFLFSGALINKARQHNMNLMLDVTPTKNWQLILSKVGAISLVQIVQLVFFLLISVTIQIINSYYEFELGLYIFQLFILLFPVLFVWNLTSHFVHALLPNIFLGLFVLACIWLGAQSLEQIGIHTNLLNYNNLPALDYTDFNGYGYQLKGYFLLVAYWFVFGLLLGVGTILIWNRGSLSSIKERGILAKSRITKTLSFIMILLAIIFCCLGFEIFKSENADEVAFLSNANRSLALKNYKEEWKQFSQITQPKITEIDLHLDIYPEEESFKARGTYKLVNQSDKIIDTIFIRTGFDEITQLDWDGLAQLLKEDTYLKTYLYKLSTPLSPGDSLDFTFYIKNTPNSLFSRNSNVLRDGTYMKHDILPRLGYQFIEQEIPLTDSLVNSYNYYHRDVDYVNINTTISTSEDQIAIAPGELIAQKKDGGRQIFEYHSSKRIKFNFSFHSSIYEVLETVYEGLSIQLYYKKGHDNNIDLMLNGLKASLDYNTKWFGQYPYKQIRIIEFPHTEESFSATLNANTIPSSELLFNINGEKMTNKLNLPFYVMAHELTHEWFGNQVIPAAAEGAKMLTESITEYLTLCIYREYLGKELANNFLELQHKRYHRGRKKEQGEERPLSKVLTHQEYISYGKGAIAFNAIAVSIGVDKFHKILQVYLMKYKYESNYYPTTNDFIQVLKGNTNKEDHDLIDQWLTQTNTLN